MLVEVTMPYHSHYVFLDCNQIQQYIFSSYRLRGICGASLLLDEVERERIPKLCNGSLIRSGGGVVIAGFDSENGKIPEKFRKDAEKEYARIGVPVTSLIFEPGDGSTSDFYIDVLKPMFNTMLQQKHNSQSLHTNLSTILAVPCENSGCEPAEHIAIPPWDSNPRRYSKIEATKVEYKREKFDLELELETKFSGFKIPRDFTGIIAWNRENISKDDLAEASDDKGLGIIYADVNGLGNLGKIFGKSQTLYHEFCNDIRETLLSSVFEGLANILTETIKEKFAGKTPPSKAGLPLKILYIGGDDLAIAVKGTYALPFIVNILEEFKKQSKQLLKRMGENEMIRGLPEYLTMSAGVVLAPFDYPIQSFNRLGKALEERAKLFGKSLEKDGIKPSLVDFCMIKNNAMGSLGTVRENKTVLDNNDRVELLLYGGPYNLQETRTLLKKAKDLTEMSFPNNKINGLRSILAKSTPNARKDYKKWRKSLTEVELKLFDEILGALGCNDPDIPQRQPYSFSYRSTPILDLIELMSLEKTNH